MKIRGQLSGADAIKRDLAKASDFSSLQSWPVGGATTTQGRSESVSTSCQLRRPAHDP